MLIERKWCMPNSLTFNIKPITELLYQEVKYGLWLDPFGNIGTFKKLFCNETAIKIIDNDLNTTYNTDYHLDALEFLKQFKDNSIDGIVYDPPYSPRQVSECYKSIGKEVTQQDTQASFWSKHKNEIARILKSNGKVICFGWNSQGLGKNRGFELNKILLVPHGGNHNDTIITVEIKL